MNELNCSKNRWTSNWGYVQVSDKANCNQYTMSQKNKQNYFCYNYDKLFWDTVYTTTSLMGVYSALQCQRSPPKLTHTFLKNLYSASNNSVVYCTYQNVWPHKHVTGLAESDMALMTWPQSAAGHQCISRLHYTPSQTCHYTPWHITVSCLQQQPSEWSVLGQVNMKLTASTSQGHSALSASRTLVASSVISSSLKKAKVLVSSLSSIWAM